MNNQACNLDKKHCVPCEGGMPPLTSEEIQPLLEEISDWKVIADKVLEKEFKKKDFAEALAFVNKIGEIAEKEGHHPDIFLHDWNKVKITLSTHAIKGLSENDFILARKIDLIA